MHSLEFYLTLGRPIIIKCILFAMSVFKNVVQKQNNKN